jgi:hypothetical protein
MKHLGVALCFFTVVATAATVGFLVARSLPSESPVAKLNLAGEYSASITVTRPDGSKATGEPWTLRFLSDRNSSGMGITYGDPPRTRQIEPAGVSLDLTLASGIVPESGVIELQNLPGGERTQPLHLTVGASGYLGFSLPDEAKLHETYSLQLPVDLQAGNQAPQIEVVRVADATKTILPTVGRVTYVEFWGVHCGPCQQPLSELDNLAGRRAKEWDGKVQLASVCLDPIDDVKRHVESNGWTHVDHFVPTSDHPTSGTPNSFGVFGVPRAFLIDATGRIAWAGHPDGFDVEREVDSLLAQ